MANKKYYWLKLKNDFFRLKEIKKLRKVAGGDTFVIIYLKMMLLSLQHDGGLIYEGTEENFAEQIALEIDEDLDNVQLTIAFMVKNNLIFETKTDEYVLPYAVDCVGSETQSAQRMRRLRNKQTASQCDTMALQCDTGVQKSDIEKEIEKDIEKETEIDRVCGDDSPQPTTTKPSKKKTFIPPTVQEVQAYCLERQNNIDAERFVDYYTSNGWKVGKNSMKDWKAALRTWERKEKEGGYHGTSSRNLDENQKNVQGEQRKYKYSGTVL